MKKPLGKMLRIHIREYVDSGIRSFSDLDQERKQHLTAYALVSDEFSHYEMLTETDNPINELIFKHVVEGKLTAEEIVKKTLDTLIEKYGDNIDEIFDEEYDNHMLFSEEVRYPLQKFEEPCRRDTL